MKIPLCGSDIQGTRKFSLPILLAGSLFASSLTLQAQVNDIGEKPYLGWSTFSEQTINSNFLTQANIQAQSDALAASGLQKHGFQYINSVVALFASWGIDFIKLDGVTPGSYSDNTSIDNRPDVAAWSKAIALSGRPIWLTVSWAIDSDYLSTWQQYSNARRIEEGSVQQTNFCIVQVCHGRCPN